MAARRAKRDALQRQDCKGRETARARVDAAKRSLGERGPPWWDDGAPDYNRHMARNSPYAAWFAGLAATDGPVER
jgi:hypothetical protein